MPVSSAVPDVVASSLDFSVGVPLQPPSTDSNACTASRCRMGKGHSDHVSRAARECLLQQSCRVLMEHLLEHPIQLRILFLKQVGDLKRNTLPAPQKIHGRSCKHNRGCRNDSWRDGKARVRHTAPSASRLAGEPGRNAVFGLFSLHQMSELAEVPTLSLVDGSSNPARRDGEDRIITQLPPSDHPKNVLVRTPGGLIFLSERTG